MTKDEKENLRSMLYSHDYEIYKMGETILFGLIPDLETLSTSPDVFDRIIGRDLKFFAGWKKLTNGAYPKIVNGRDVTLELVFDNFDRLIEKKNG